MRIYAHTETCIQSFITALSIIVKKWKQPKLSPIDEWISKMWCIYIMECYSHKKNEVLIYVATWNSLENITLSKRIQSQKTTYHMVSFIWKSTIGKSTSRKWLLWMGWRDESVITKGYGGDGCTYLWIHWAKNHQIVHFKWVNCMICELYLDKVFQKKEKKMKQWFLPSPDMLWGSNELFLQIRKPLENYTMNVIFRLNYSLNSRLIYWRNFSSDS